MSLDIEKSKENGYSNEVFRWLMDLPIGSTIIVDKYVDAKTKHYFIDVVKWYIHCYGDVEFSGDYSKLRKIKPFNDSAI